MSFLGKLFGTDKARDALIDGTVKGLDALYYSKEEKAQDAAKGRTEARTMVIEWMKNTQGQNLARRVIALMVTVVWLSQYIIMQILSVFAIWTNNVGVVTADKLLESSKVVGDYADSMNGAMMLILAFYFAAPYMGKVVDTAMSKLK